MTTEIRAAETSIQPRPQVTVLAASFPPAFLQGGPARSLGALTELLHDAFDFSVITSAFDDPKLGQMPGVEPDRWIETTGARVCYIGARRPSLRTIYGLVTDTKPDLLYLNSLFDARFSIFPLLTSRILQPKRRVLLAPRGECSAGAIGIRAWKKRLFLMAFRTARLHRFVTWHASTEMEAADIARAMRPWEYCTSAAVRRVCGQVRKATVPLRIEVARNPSPVRPGPSNREVRSLGDSIVFFSRIVPKKNLHTLLEAITQISGDVNLTVAGPTEDIAYWDRCQAMISLLPDGKTVNYIGSIPGDDVVKFLADFDLFVLPTLGENFGHAVLEALTAGLPVIVGRDTPWAVIEEAGAGWICDPRDPHSLAQRITEFRSLSATAKAEMRESARLLAEMVARDPATEAANRRLFRIAAGDVTS